MMLRTVIRDCLFLNWALPAEALPEPPAPLRYELHSAEGRSYVFASAVLFHQDAIHLTSLPLLRVRYPQLNLRLHVLDAEGLPSVLFRKMLMPAWMVPGVRLVTHQPASHARLDFPRPSRDGGGSWRWRAQRNGRLEVRAWQASPMVGEGPRLGSWDETVRYFQERQRGYAESAGTLHRIEARRPSFAAAWPLRAEIGADDLLSRMLPLRRSGQNGGQNGAWPALHSAWLCPEIPFVFELVAVPRVAMAPSMPQPAAGRVASPVLRSDVLPPEGVVSELLPERRRASC
jgi:hypothetical protein